MALACHGKILLTDMPCLVMICICMHIHMQQGSPFPNAGLDLENDAAAANSMLPELRLDNPTNASIAKLPLPHAKQDTMATAQHRLLPNGQQAPSNQQQQEQQQEGGSVAQAGVGSDAKQHGAAPTGWVTPAQMIFPRAAIFYCSSFSASCGLPKHSEPCSPPSPQPPMHTTLLATLHVTPQIMPGRKSFPQTKLL